MAYFRRSSVLLAVGALRESSSICWSLALQRRASFSFPPLLETRRFYSQGVGTALSATNTQVYTTPTYDAAFKHVLSFEEVRPSFFRAFIPDMIIKSSKPLDGHMNPVQELQLLRQFLHDKATSDIVQKLKASGDYVVSVRNPPGTKSAKQNVKRVPGFLKIENVKATDFLKKIVGRFEEIQGSFPPQSFNGSMDFVCRLDSGDLALVEMQVMPANYWDRRALAYVAALFGNQLNRGGEWKEIKKVIGVNILGGGRENKGTWSDSRDHYMRHYKLEDQLNGKGRFIDGIELIQYSLMNAPTVDDQEKNDWITFLKMAQYMTEKEVADRIQTPAVLRAFEVAKISKLPADIRASYEAQDEEYTRHSLYTAQVKQSAKIEGKIEGKIEVALNMIKRGLLLRDVCEYTGLSPESIEGISNLDPEG